MNRSSSASEFDIIRRYFSDIGIDSSLADPLVQVGVGDDCALLSIPNGQRLAISIDTLVVGQHFPDSAGGYDIAQRALAVAVSDLAGVGARPLAFTLALTLPEADEPWLQQFSQGLRDSARQYDIALVGGDTTKGQLTISIQVHGLLPVGVSLLRSAAKPGEQVFVSGSLGDAALALQTLQHKRSVNSEQQRFLHSRFYQPRARVELGQALLGVASAAIDVSDGLLADLGHIAKASGVAATLYSDKLPLSNVLRDVLDVPNALELALTGGDDYELCFTAGRCQIPTLVRFAKQFDVPITCIGEIHAGEGVSCLGADNKPINMERSGFQHF